MNLRLHSMSSYSPANESQTAFPWDPIPQSMDSRLRLQSWVPIPLPMNLMPMNLRLHSHEFLFPANEVNLRLHSHEFKFLFPCQWISDCIPMSSYSQPMNLRMHSMSSSSYLPADESQTAFPWVPIPCQWIQDSDCIPMRSYSPAKILESFGWVPPMSYHPDSGMPIESPRMRPERDFVYTPIHTTWVPLKSIVEHFRALLRDFCFWAIFLGFPNRKNLDLRRRSAYQRKRGDWSTIQSPQMVIQNGSGMTKITA